MSNFSSTLDQQPVVYIGPDGGTTGQVLAKKSNTDRDIEWVDYFPALFAYSLTYNYIGQPITAAANNKTYTMTYDSLNRLSTVSDGTKTIQCQYNDYGQFTGTVTA